MDLDRLWYVRHPLSLLLLPLSGVYCGVVRVRRLLYRHGLLSSYKAPVPVVIVGNLTVGGTGKTPLVISLAKLLRQQGFFPGIVTRGYQGQAKVWPQAVDAHSDPYLVGDEPVLLARHAGCPVAAAPKRRDAVRLLIRRFGCTVILSDDGLQHYALQREVEIATVDARDGYGNRRCLPAGPLREPLSRLNAVNFIVTRGVSLDPAQPYDMQYQVAEHLRRVKDDCAGEALSAWRGRKVHALAAIARPRRFFQMLRSEGLEILPHAYPDHHRFRRADIQFNDRLPVIMTEKDAVKCRSIAGDAYWYLAVDARLSPAFAHDITALLKLRRQQGSLMDPKLLDILVCPVCKGPLVYRQQAQELHCRACRLAYFIRDEVPVMLEDEARRLNLEELDQ